ncbi:ABC transporter ATP-binding protein [Legionella londiniensis]|uniref:ABC transporter ATP-binding protein n=1 Tax=Legionella londiniensis TaxID=45068 RepID=A0A0W0VI49_9GAMM|nr:ABC transporter ATP-binding protein [Legionella londiniensis]KTD19793.1 ABC transporter ATP-binding protein [Legionella londiniensis]STX92296.1 ABC transporter ATP-binding protein [Legionella londiniensis]
MPLIALHNIVKKYRIGSLESTVLKQISLNIHAGDLLAIVGASGSGKSTLMNIIGLLDKPDTGDYFLSDRNVACLNQDELAAVRNQQIGFVFQQFNLLPRFNAWQNVSLPLTYRDIAQKTLKEKAHAALERVGMGEFIEHRPTELSGGQQQRVAIARALVTEPQVILADEPTGALDSRTGKEIMNLFIELNQEGRTIILVTHDGKIADLCSRCITLADGQIVKES